MKRLLVGVAALVAVVVALAGCYGPPTTTVSADHYSATVQFNSKYEVDAGHIYVHVKYKCLAETFWRTTSPYGINLAVAPSDPAITVHCSPTQGIVQDAFLEPG